LSITQSCIPALAFAFLGQIKRTGQLVKDSQQRCYRYHTYNQNTEKEQHTLLHGTPRLSTGLFKRSISIIPTLNAVYLWLKCLIIYSTFNHLIVVVCCSDLCYKLAFTISAGIKEDAFPGYNLQCLYRKSKFLVNITPET